MTMDMREIMQIVEGASQAEYSAKADADYIIHYVADLNDREDPYEGEVPEWISQYPTYTLQQFPTSKLDLDGYGYSQSLASEYAAMDAATAPPIVINAHGEIIDGYHRAQAAIQRGDATILAYVGE